MGTPIEPTSSKPREACGIVGIYIPGEDVAKTTFYALFALQHRGQESAGISASNGRNIRSKRGMGLIGHVFEEEHMERLPGHIAIGHTRYSTMGSSRKDNIQPLRVRRLGGGKMMVGHNGNLINASALRKTIVKDWGLQMSSSSDSEVIAEMYANAPGDTWAERSHYCFARLQGAYSLVIMTAKELVAVRDPIGIRPLCLGKIGNGWIVASETAALSNVGAEFVRELENGETLVINENGIHSDIWASARSSDAGALCVFEYIYFARPDSNLRGHLAYRARERMGEILAREHPADVDLVIGVPDSATAAGVGYARAAGVEYAEGLIRNRYVGRTFISPDQRIRSLGVGMKFNAMPEVIGGKRIVVVDDSIVRGTTTPKVVKMLRDAGAREIHIRISSPPIVSTCHFGVDMAATRDLIAANKTLEEIREYLQADSLGYLSHEGLMEAVSSPGGKGLCSGCFTRKYPIDVQLDMDKLELEHSSA